MTGYDAWKTTPPWDGLVEIDGVEVEMMVDRDGVELWVAVVAGDDVAVVMEPEDMAGTTLTLTRSERYRAEDYAVEAMTRDADARRDDEADARYDARNDR